MRLTWKPSIAASAIHAAWAVVHKQPLIDARINSELSFAARNLSQTLPPQSSKVSDYWPLLIYLAGQNEKSTTLAARFMEVANDAAATQSLENVLGQLLVKYLELYPSVAEELSLREGPLRMAWEARGPGLLKTLFHRSPEQFSPQEEMQLLLVLPALGGAGAWHHPFASVHIEAVLANPHAALPEVVRLAWLLAQSCHRERRNPRLNPLNLLVPVLAAAEEVELARCDLTTVQIALRAWRLVDERASEADIDVVAQRLFEEFITSRDHAT